MIRERLFQDHPDGGLGGAGMDAGADAGVNDAGCATGVCDDGGESLPGGIHVPIVTPLISADPVVLVKKPYMTPGPSRKQVLLSVDDAGFDGHGTFTFAGGGTIRFFTITGREVHSGDVFSGPELATLVRLEAEGASPSAAMNDVVLTLTLTPGSKPVNPPATDRMTAVEVTLDIHFSRTARGTDPAVLSVAQKTGNPGRIVHVQNASLHHGRALLIVRKAVPAAFTGTWF
jgi:hypothetical protein